MLSKKELELELANKGAEVMKERFDKISEIDKRITELEERFYRHVNDLSAHRE